MTLFEHIKKLLVDKFGIDPEKIVPEATFEDLGIDSLSLTELVWMVSEERPGLDTENLRDIRTIGEAVKALEGK